MNGSRVHSGGKSIAHRAAVVPVIHRDAHLDQFVRRERAVYFRKDFRCGSGVSNPHGRCQRMRERLEVSALL